MNILKCLSPEWISILYSVKTKPLFDKLKNYEWIKPFQSIELNAVKVIIEHDAEIKLPSVLTIIKGDANFIAYINLVLEQICKYHYDECNQLICALHNTYNIDKEYHNVIAYDKNHINKLLVAEGECPINWAADSEEKTIGCLNFNDTIVFTDGSCNPNNKSPKSRGGYAVYFASGHMNGTVVVGNLDISVYASNIRAEGYAIIRTLELVDLSEPINKLIIITDCEFWINMVETYMPKWRTFDDKANPDMTKRMWMIYNKVIKKCEVKFMHVKSHNKSGWKSFKQGSFERYCYEKNEYVDKLCSSARINLKPGEENQSYNLNN